MQAGGVSSAGMDVLKMGTKLRRLAGHLGRMYGVAVRRDLSSHTSFYSMRQGRSQQTG